MIVSILLTVATPYMTYTHIYTGTPDVASLLKMDEGALQGIEMRNGDPKVYI